MCLVTLLSSEQKIAIWKILPATHSNYKQNIKFHNKNGLGVMPRQAELTAIAFDV